MALVSQKQMCGVLKKLEREPDFKDKYNVEIRYNEGLEL